MRDAILQLQSYCWPELWRAVRHLQPEPGAQRSPALAIKAMLLVGWWQQEEQARKCAAPYPERIADPLTHYALSYTALCLGEVLRYNILQRDIPSRQPAWMRQSLELEILGRAGKTSEQIQLLHRLTSADKPLPDWACVALLQSNDVLSRDITLLRDWLLNLSPSQRARPLVRALAARCGVTEAWLLDGVPESLESMPAPVLYRYALWLLSQGQLPQALLAFDHLARQEFVDLSVLKAWLGLACSIPQGWAGIVERIQHAINLVPQNLNIQGTVACVALIVAWLRDDLVRADVIAKRFIDYLKLPKSTAISTFQILFLYGCQLSHFRQTSPENYFPPVAGRAVAPLVALGESHSMTLANLYFPWLAGDVKGLTAFVMGAKMHHLGDTTPHYQGECVRLHLEALKVKPVHLLMTIGEIDCRPDEGLWPLHRKTGQPLDTLIERTVTGYIDFLQRTLAGHQLASISVQGIPAPGYALEDDKNPGDIPGFVAMIRAVNDCLQAKALAAGFNFLDVHAATVGEDGRGNGRWHLDDYHLSPAFYRQAQDWLLTPN